MGKPSYRTNPAKTTRENPVEAFLITTHTGQELTIIVTATIEEALRQAREEETVRKAIRRDGGIAVRMLRD